MVGGVSEIYLIRHARAVDHASNDWERSLTADGWREARAVGAALKKAGVQLDAVVASPLVRAVQTATLIAMELGIEDGITIDRALVPEGNTNAMIAVASQARGARVALVGHEPSMGQLLSDLVGRPGMSLVKAGVVKLSVDDAPSRGAAKLVWTLSPRHLVPQIAR